MSLYNKYRPAMFQDVIGQSESVSALKNMVQNLKTHSIMFVGTHGTGKTTLAKIFGRAINCLEPVEGYEPCGKCAACTSNSSDFYEFDAASNNGVEDIRGILDNARYLPAMLKYKVYIIDEVHMLSKGAFNALLKTLEEPPKHAVFVLCTTEPNKIPPTIISRCIRYELNRISVEDIISRLDHVCTSEKRSAERSALRLIAANASGALRDALSMLEQAFYLSSDVITENDVATMLGCSDNSMVVAIVHSLLKRNLSDLLRTIQSIVEAGKDAYILTQDMTKVLRDMMIVKASSDYILADTKEYQKMIKEVSGRYNIIDIVAALQLCVGLSGKLKYSLSPVFELEMGLTRFCIDEVASEQRTVQSTPEPSSSPEILRRISILENKLKEFPISFFEFPKDEFPVDQGHGEEENPSNLPLAGEISAMEVDKEANEQFKIADVMEAASEDSILKTIIQYASLKESQGKVRVCLKLRSLYNVAISLFNGMNGVDFVFEG